MWRKVLGVLLGLSVAITVITLLQGVGHKLWPLPADLVPGDRAAIAEAVRNAPVLALAWVALAWFAGTAAGGYTALRIARDAVTTWPAIVVEAVLLAFGSLTLLSIPHPGWFWVVGLLSFPLGAFAAIRQARRALGQAA
jgi:hypothetical protein